MGDNLTVGNILTELGIRTEDAKCNLIGGGGVMCNFANLVLIVKVVWVSTISRQAINPIVIKMISPYKYASLKAKKA